MSNVLCNGKSSVDATEVIPIRIESETGGIFVISPNHAFIHEGTSFSLDGELLALAAGASARLLLDASAAAKFHWSGYQMECTGSPVTIELYESPTVTAAGTPIVGINRNREVATPPKAVTTVNPTVTDNGTLLHHADIFADGAGNNAIGRIGREVDEWIFDATKLYLMEITNDNGQALDIHYTFFWHEHY